MAGVVLMLGVAMAITGCADEDAAVSTQPGVGVSSTSPPSSTTAPPATVAPTSTTVSPPTTAPDSTTTTAPPVAITALAEPGARTEWSGTIDTDIDISLWLAEEDGRIRGELVYDRVGEPILLLGRRITDQFVVIHEFAADGRVTGTLSFDDPLDRSEPIAGLWGELDLELRYEGIAAEPHRFDPLVQDGIYVYQFRPFGDALDPVGDPIWGSSGWLRVETVGTDQLLVEFQNTRRAPSYNLAIVEPAVVPLENNRAVFDGAEIAPDWLADCAFEIVIFDEYAFVEHVDERWQCGFGMGAGVEMEYVRISALD